MPTASEEIQARKAKYDRVERAMDTTGRAIGVKRLRPSQQLAVQEMAPGLEGTTSVVDDNPKSDTFGQTFEVPKSSPLIMAASVCEIDGDMIPFARSRAELNSVLDRLDEEGLTAVTIALAKLNPTKKEGSEAQEKPVEEQAKNL